MISDMINSLNPMQKKAVLKTEGPLLLLAGAGSGKTRVLTHRIAYLIENGVRPFNILAITFTNKAAREMKERVESITPFGKDVLVSTFHSACVRILRREIENIDYSRSFTIYDAEDSEKLIREICKELNISDKLYPVKSVMSKIGAQKDNLISAEQYLKDVSDFREETIAKIYFEYQKRLKANNSLDFDDIIFKTVQLFRERPDILEKYQDRFRYIMVDEYQDTNTSQYTLVKLLSDKYKNLCVVGDDDQSIYGWRGANIRNILDFEKDFKDAETIKLEQNYRSTQVILDAANEVIKNNFGRKSKSLWTENSKGEEIKFYRANNDLDESSFIADQIKKAVESGAKYSNFAVLYRNNALSRTIEEKFIKNSIPYHLFGGTSFYSRKEIKDVMAYLKVLYNPADVIQLKRIINVPKRGIGDSTIEKLTHYADENGITLYESLFNLDDIPELKARAKNLKEFASLITELQEEIQELTITELINSVLYKTNYILELKNEGTEEALGRIENIEELISKAAEFEETAEEPTLAAFLEDVALVADIDNYTENDDTVILMTLHSSKGLEFPTVFIVGFEEGIFPSYRSIMDPSPNALEEERRLCYVGITRAKENLYLTCAKSRLQHGQYVSNLPSRFFKEIPEDFIKSENILENHINTSVPKQTATFRTQADYKGGGIKSYKSNIPSPKNVTLEFEIGDKVRQLKYGIGTVKEINPAGADYEVTVEFPQIGTKKFMANLSKLKKVN